jgi:hypothetical protein
VFSAPGTFYSFERPFPFQFKISLGWLLSALLLAKLFGVYPIFPPNLIVSIESAKSNYQLCKTASQKKENFIFKSLLPKPAHRLPPKTHPKSRVKAILIFPVRR